MGTVFQIPWTYLGGEFNETSGWPGTECDVLATETIAECDYTVKIPIMNSLKMLSKTPRVLIHRVVIRLPITH